jgi:predicted ester cyclase
VGSARRAGHARLRAPQLRRRARSAQFKQSARWIRSGVPDFRVEIEDWIEDGERVAMRFVGRGTHSGSLAGEAPTSRSVALHGVRSYRFRDGLIAEDWEAMDEGQLLKQISP